MTGPAKHSDTVIACTACGIWHEPGMHVAATVGPTPTDTDRLDYLARSFTGLSAREGYWRTPEQEWVCLRQHESATYGASPREAIDRAMGFHAQPMRPGESLVGSDTRELADQARESSAMSKGIDAMDREEWREMALVYKSALEQIGVELRNGAKRTDLLRMVDDALAEAGLE